MEILAKLQAENIKVYRTDEVGNVVIISDGKAIKVDKKASAGSSTKGDEQTDSASTSTDEKVEENTQEAVSNLSIEHVSSLVSKGLQATVTIKGAANETYDISVYYSSGPSKAKGLVPKKADGMVKYPGHGKLVPERNLVLMILSLLEIRNLKQSNLR